MNLADRRVCGLVMLAAAATPAMFGQYTFSDARTTLKTYCQTCHQGASAPAHLDLTRFTNEDSLAQQPQVWSRIYQRVREGSMPPKGLPAPDAQQRDQLAGWIEQT